MKTTRKTLSLLFALLIAISAWGQELAAVLEYVKVKPGMSSEFLELEKEVRRVHQHRVESGKIIQWELYKVFYAAADDPYDYVLVHVYDDYKKSERPVNWDWIRENYTEEEIDKYGERFRATRTIVKREVYFNRFMAENSGDVKYFVFNRFKVKPGKWEDYNMYQKEMIQPVMEEMINMGAMSNWSSWDVFPYNRKFDLISVDGYNEFGQWRERWPELKEAYTKVHNDDKFDETGEKIRAAREMVSQEIWELVDIVRAEDEE